MRLMRLSTLLTGTISAVILVMLCAVSHAQISRATVNHAWRRICEADGFCAIPINYEDESEPNAWVAFKDESNFTLHVTAGLMSILGTEDEIAGVLGHELGHIRLGHYGGMVVDDAARTVMGVNSELADDISRAVGDMNQELQESAFSRKDETSADDYGVELLVKAGYDPWGLYHAMRRFEVTEHSGFSSHPATRERLAHLADKAGSFRGRGKGGESRRDSADDIADILMGQ